MLTQANCGDRLNQQPMKCHREKPRMTSKENADRSKQAQTGIIWHAHDLKLTLA